MHGPINNFAPEKEAQPARLIVEVGNPADASTPNTSNKKVMKRKTENWMPEKPLTFCA